MTFCCGCRETLIAPIDLHDAPLIWAVTVPFEVPPDGGPVGFPLSSSSPPPHASAANVATSARVFTTRIEPPGHRQQTSPDPLCAKITEELSGPWSRSPNIHRWSV